MKFNISFQRTYPHPVEKVWRALTDAQALSAWLLDTDFVPQVDRSFQMWCPNSVGGTDTYDCKLIEYEPPRRMLWSWLLDGRQADGETFVEFTVTAVDDGTRVIISHRGDRDRATIDAFKGGWPTKLDQLGDTLAAA